MYIRIRQGDERWTYLTTGLMQYEDAAAVMVTGFDVTDRRMAAENLLRSYTVDGTVKLNIDVRDILISIDLAIPCGLIINELVSNSLKYAFPGSRTGTITVAMSGDGGDYVLSLRDNGVGMPRHSDFRNAGSFGLQLVDTLVNQPEGSLAGEDGDCLQDQVRRQEMSEE